MLLGWTCFWPSNQFTHLISLFNGCMSWVTLIVLPYLTILSQCCNMWKHKFLNCALMSMVRSASCMAACDGDWGTCGPTFFILQTMHLQVPSHVLSSVFCLSIFFFFVCLVIYYIQMVMITRSFFIFSWIPLLG